MTETGHLRIGELSRRTGTSVDLLRAWEKRYGLLEPGPLRRRLPPLLGRRRRARPRRCRAISPTALPRRRPRARALEEPGRRPDGVGDLVAQSRRELADALAAFSEGRANAVLDRLLGALSVDAVLRDVVLPYLHELGEAWERGEASVAQEHFASNVLRGRLLGLGARLGRGIRPARAARLPAAGTARPRADRLRPRSAQPRLANHLSRPGHPALDARAGSAGAGARIASSSPPRTPSGSTTPWPISRGWLRAAPLSIGGAGASPSWRRRPGRRLLGGDPVSEAELLTRELRAGARAQT